MHFATKQLGGAREGWKGSHDAATPAMAFAPAIHFA
jgi:hypothetical protein